MIKTNKRALRRFLLEKQLLLAPRTNKAADHEQVLGIIRLLECLQIDPVAAVRANQHLVMSARLSGYEPSFLNDLLSDHKVFEYFANAACIIPMEDYPLFEPTRTRIREHAASALEALRPVPEQVTDKLRAEGPLPARAFESDRKVHGYWENANSAAKTKATSHAINLLTDSALIRIVGREGNQRLFDLTSRSVPEELLKAAGDLTREEAERQMLLKYFRAYRVFEPSDSRFGWLRYSAARRRDVIRQFIDDGILAEVEAEGLKHPYYVLASDAERVLAHHDAASEEQDPTLEAEASEITFLPPLDNLLWSRKRLEDLFHFEYRWEIYTPAVKRKYGYYAMPILAGDRLIGRMDPRLERKENVLKVELLHFEPDVKVSALLRKHVKQAVKAFAKANGAVHVVYN